MFKKEDGHMMLDIETLSTRSTAPILQIGFAFADAGGILTSGKITIPVKEIDFLLYPITGETLTWWLAQKKEAIDSVFFPSHDGGDIDTLENALRKLTYFIDSTRAAYPDLTVWANHPQFDIAILANAYETEGVDKPIYPLYQVLDYATMRKMSQVLPATTNLLPHDAECDCVYQLSHLMDIFDNLSRVQELAQERLNNTNPNLH
jgi:hypothetical protein